MRRTRFLLRVAALYATEEGTLLGLARACGLHEKILGVYASRGRPLPAQIAAKIATATDGLVTLFMLRPDLAPREPADQQG